MYFTIRLIGDNKYEQGPVFLELITNQGSMSEMISRKPAVYYGTVPRLLKD